MTIISFLGLIALILATSISFVQFFIKKNTEYVKLLLVGSSFGFLILAFVFNDFSLVSVAENSSILQPLVYKIAASWSHHEGSMLFWVLIMQIYAAAFYKYSQLDQNIKDFALKINNFTIFALLLYIITISNPFSHVDKIITNGFGLNPVLQDYFVAIHPPKLYFGYVGTAILFAICLGILAKGDLSKPEIFVKLDPWITFAWMTLTGGIILGGNWAYRELGWGGFWSWDPVENISIIPWIIMTVMFHANLVAKKQPLLLGKTVILCGIISFIASIFGTSLVRSGNLNSLHSFSQDNTRWITMLIIVGMLCVISGFIIFKNYKKFTNFEYKESLSHIYIIRLANILLILIAVFITLGTILPIFTKNTSNIDANFFNNICFFPAFLCLILCSIVPLIGKVKKTQITITILICIILSTIFIYRYYDLFTWKNYFGLPLVFVSLIIISGLLSVIFISKKSFIILWAHGGFSLIVIGLILPMTLGFERDISIEKNKNVFINKYEFLLNDMIYDYGKNYLTRKINVIIKKNDIVIGNLSPETRFYIIENTFTSETSTLTDGIDDVYLAISGVNLENKTDPKIHLHIAYRPGIKLLWIGAFISLIGIAAKFLRIIYL